MAALDEQLSPSPICRVAGLTFAYPGREDEPVLRDVSLSVAAGAFCVIVGPTGCGKTTLLRCLKPELAPAGVQRGTVEVLGQVLAGGNGCRADGAGADEDAGAGSATGSPAAGEAAGAAADSPAARKGACTAAASPAARAERRAADSPADGRWSATNIGFVMQDPAEQIVCDTVWHELAFGLENIGMPQDRMRRRIAEVAHFFGIEPIMHAATETLSGGQQQLVNLAAVLALRPRLLVLDEPTAQLDPNAQREFLFLLGRVNRELGVTVIMSTHAPEATQPYATQTIELGDEMPLGTHTTLEGRLAGRWSYWESRRADEEAVLTTRDLHVRYDRAAPWVLRGVNLRVARGSVHAIVGGNGCGKSTLLKALAGIIKPQRGRVQNALAEHQAYLPQNPQALLVCDTVAEELTEWAGRCGYSASDAARAGEQLGLAGLEGRHPDDLSGGQQQKLALAKLLLTKPDLLFLDEPTKGLDPAGAAETVRILRGLAEGGRTVVMVTHDLDVALAVADEVSMVFDGEIACTEPARAFFAENLVYRPHDASRLFGALAGEEKATTGTSPAGATPVTCTAPCGNRAASILDDENPDDATAQARSATAGTDPAQSVRADAAAGSSSTAFASSAIGSSPDARLAAGSPTPSSSLPHTPSAGPRNSRARAAVEAMALVAVPIVLVIAGLVGFSQTALLSFAVVIAALAVFFASYEAGSARLHEIMPTVVLAALAAAGRIVFAALPSIKPVSAIAIIAGVALGRRSGFMTGALAALVSNFFFGQGPWTPWQMYAWGLVGYGAGALAQLWRRAGGSRTSRGGKTRGRLAMLGLCAYGFVASVAYGWILNAWSILGFLHAHLGFEVLAVYAASLPFDVAHGVSTVVFLLVLYAPWRRKLNRVTRRYRL